MRHARERLLDAHGNAVRNAKGTPIRPSFYTFAVAPPRARPKLPGKVPVTDLVPHRPLQSRPRFPDGNRPAQPEQPGQPLRRAA